MESHDSQVVCMYICTLFHYNNLYCSHGGITCVTRPEPDSAVESSPLFLVTVAIDNWSRTSSTFRYFRDPEIDSISPLSSIAS